MLRYALAFVTVALVLAASGGPSCVAEAAQLRCGMVLNEQAVLDRDLVCDGPALVVRNPRTVLQLNGHTLKSRRSCSEGAAPNGIVIEPTADGAQVIGPGEVRGFVNGIQVAGASRVRIRDLRVDDSCVNGVLIASTWDTRLDGVTLHRNGREHDDGTAIRVEEADRFGLETSEIFLNGRGDKGGAIDLRKCDHCRIAGNRILANRAAGLRLDLDTHDALVERNLMLDNSFADVIDEGVDNTFVLNELERGNGVASPSLWPLRGQSHRGVPAVAGCATVADFVTPHQTVTVTCPQDPQLRGLRNSVVGYRLLLGTTPYGAGCAKVDLKPAYSGGGGSVTCTSPESLWGLVLEVTCCLN